MSNVTLILLITCLFCAPISGIEVEKLVILGGGPSGLTSSLFAAQSHLNPVVIEGDPSEGQIASIYKIENYPGIPEGISGQELSRRIHIQAEFFGARFNSSKAISADLSQRPFQIQLENGEELYCESLVIATGASPKWLGLETESALIGKGISASATLDAAKFEDQVVVVIGGGDSAMEQALLLTEYASHVTIIYKGEHLYGASYLQERVMHHPKIDFKFHTEVIHIFGVNEGKVTGMLLRDTISQKELSFDCEGIFISNGRVPNTQLFEGQLEMTKSGYIITKENSTQTNIPGVFAAGDITHSPYRKVITAVSYGCMSAIDAANFLKANKNN